MPMVTVDGAKLWYQIRGTGTPLVCIGGFALVDRQFEFCDTYLTKKHAVLHWHYRGVGKSDWTMTQAYSVERWVDDLKAIIDHAGLKKVSIWCTSTGSAIGTRFAAKYPDNMHALIAYPWVRADATWRDIFKASYEVARVFGIEQLSRLFAGVVLPPKLLYSAAGIKYERWAKLRYAENVNMTTLHSVIDAYANVDLTSDIRNIRCPTMLLMGNDSALNDNDRMESASYAALIGDFKRLKPNVKVATVRGAGSTYCMITKPKACSEMVMAFLQNLAKPARRARRGR